MGSLLSKSLVLLACLVLLVIPTAQGEPCKWANKGSFKVLRPYEAKYQKEFDALFFCDTSTTQEFNDFMHSALTDDELDPVLTSQFLHQLRDRNPLSAVILSPPITPSHSPSELANLVSFEVLLSISLQEADVEHFLKRLTQEAEKPAHTNRSFEANWNQEGVLGVELNARQLLLPQEAVEVLRPLYLCTTDLPTMFFGSDSSQYCMDAESNYSKMLQKYKNEEEIIRNLQRWRVVAEMKAQLSNRRMNKKLKPQ